MEFFNLSNYDIDDTNLPLAIDWAKDFAVSKGIFYNLSHSKILVYFQNVKECNNYVWHSVGQVMFVKNCSSFFNLF